MKKSAASVNMNFKLDEKKGNAICQACDDVMSGTMWIHFPLKLW
jgi:fumarate hydratase class II